MTRSHPFQDTPVIGALAPAEAAARLRELGDMKTASALEPTDDTKSPTAALGGVRSFWPFNDKPWQHTAHAFGYLAPAAIGTATLPIRQVGEVAADESLRGQRLKITLDRLRVAEYPGSGTHPVLFEFHAQKHLRP